MKARQEKAVKRVKRITKQERIRNVYAAYGIEYDVKTKKIFSPVNGGMWINPVLVNGNEKICRGAYHFSTLPANIHYHINIALTRKQKISTNKKSKNYGKLVKYTAIDDENPVFVDVDGTCVCKCDGCYALTGNYIYETTKAYLAIRTVLARDYMSFLENAIRAQIIAENIQLLRIHAAGDFFSGEYVDMWKRIIADNKNVLFWTYTKVTEYETAFDEYENANIIPSILMFKAAGLKGFNYGKCDYIMRAYQILTTLGYRVHICFCGIEKAANLKPVHCTECHCCAECDYVLFIEHSTDYVAEKDPLFPALVKMILEQPIKTPAIENAA